MTNSWKDWSHLSITNVNRHPQSVSFGPSFPEHCLCLSVLSLLSIRGWVPMHMWGSVSLAMWQVSSAWVMWQHHWWDVWMHQCPSPWWRILPALPTQYVLMSGHSWHKAVDTAKNLKLWHCTRPQFSWVLNVRVWTHTGIDETIDMVESLTLKTPAHLWKSLFKKHFIMCCDDLLPNVSKLLGE